MRKILQWLHTMQELAIALNLVKISCNIVLYGFENDGGQKNRHHPLFGQKMRQFKQDLHSGSFNGDF